MHPKTILPVSFRHAATIAVLITGLFTSLATPAANKYWIGGSDWWDIGTNWSPAGQPLNGDYVYLTQSDSISRTVYYANTLYPTARITQLDLDATGAGSITLSQSNDSLLVNFERVGYTGIGIHDQNGGLNTVGTLSLGVNASGHGTYNLYGTGNLTVNLSQYVGLNGVGIFNQDGGTNTVGDQLFLGYLGSSHGYYNLTSGSLAVQNYSEYIGYLGVGTFNQSGGAHHAGVPLYLGYSSGSSGTYNLSGTGTLTAFSEFIGYNGTGNFNQTGGTNTISGQLVVSSINTGTYNLSDGSLVTNFTSVGSSKTGVFIQSGGSHTINTRLNVTGYGSGSGTYHLNGGNLNVNSETIGYAGVGTFSQSAGTHTINQELSLGVGGSATYNLSSGTLNVGGNISSGGIGSSTFNLDGGTLNVSGTIIGFDEFRIGNATGSTGNFALESGKMMSATNVTIGNSGSGVLTQNGGIHTITNSLTLATNVGSSGVYNLNDGALRATTITVNSGGIFNFNGGTLSVAQFNGDLANHGGTLAPGNSPGITNITGNYSQSGMGIFTVEIGGTGLGEYDSLNILGTATLDGTLNVSLFNLGSGLFAPQVGDTFDILTAQMLSGQFSTYNLAALGDGLTWNISYLTDAIDTTDIVRLSVVSAVPVPPAIWLFGSGLIGLIGIARKRKLH